MIERPNDHAGFGAGGAAMPQALRVVQRRNAGPGDATGGAAPLAKGVQRNAAHILRSLEDGGFKEGGASGAADGC